MNKNMFSYNTPEGREVLIHKNIFFRSITLSFLLAFLPLLPSLMVFRYFISRAYVTYTIAFFLLYSVINICIPLALLLYQYLFLRNKSWWIKEYIIIYACFIESFYAFTTFLIAKNFFTYIEYFLFPIIRLSMLLVICMFIIRQVRTMFLVISMIIIFITGIFSVSSAVIAEVEKMILGIFAVILCIVIVVQISIYKRHQNIYP